jgi:hypothetical protein
VSKPVPEEIRIASLLPRDPPRYVIPVLPGVEQTPVRIAGVVRGAAGVAPEITVLAPDHVGLTVRGSPTLHWSLLHATPSRVELVLSDDRFPDPLLDVSLPDGAKAGIHAFDLQEHGVELETDVTYRWFASIVPDPEDRSSEIVSGGAIRRVQPSPELAARLERAAPRGLAHLYAEAGLFYDALDQLSEWIDREPEASVLRRQRAALLAQVGLASAVEPERGGTPDARP